MRACVRRAGGGSVVRGVCVSLYMKRVGAGCSSACRRGDRGDSGGIAEPGFLGGWGGDGEVVVIV